MPSMHSAYPSDEHQAKKSSTNIANNLSFGAGAKPKFRARSSSVRLHNSNEDDSDPSHISKDLLVQDSSSLEDDKLKAGHMRKTVPYLNLHIVDESETPSPSRKPS